MRTRRILMPMRKPPEEVSAQERLKVFTWEVDEKVPETVQEAIRNVLVEERLATFGTLFKPQGTTNA